MNTIHPYPSPPYDDSTQDFLIEEPEFTFYNDDHVTIVTSNRKRKPPDRRKFHEEERSKEERRISQKCETQETDCRKSQREGRMPINGKKRKSLHIERAKIPTKDRTSQEEERPSSISEGKSSFKSKSASSSNYESHHIFQEGKRLSIDGKRSESLDSKRGKSHTRERRKSEEEKRPSNRISESENSIKSTSRISCHDSLSKKLKKGNSLCNLSEKDELVYGSTTNHSKKSKKKDKFKLKNFIRKRITSPLDVDDNSNGDDSININTHFVNSNKFNEDSNHPSIINTKHVDQGNKDKPLKNQKKGKKAWCKVCEKPIKRKKFEEHLFFGPINCLKCKWEAQNCPTFFRTFYSKCQHDVKYSSLLVRELLDYFELSNESIRFINENLSAYLKVLSPLANKKPWNSAFAIFEEFLNKKFEGSKIDMPSNDRYLCVREPIESCPDCYSKLPVENLTFDLGNLLLKITCDKCKLAIFIILKRSLIEISEAI